MRNDPHTLVEGALRNALGASDSQAQRGEVKTASPSLFQNFGTTEKSGAKIKVVLEAADENTPAQP